MDRNEFSQDIEALITEYEKRIYNLLLSLSGNADEAKDLTQETFIKTYLKLCSFQNKSDIYTWLYRIAINCWKNKLRYNYSRGFLLTSSLDSITDNESFALKENLKTSELAIEQSLDNSEICKLITKEIHQLPPKYKIPITLYIKELTIEEIAKILDCRVGTAKSLISRAKDRLKDRILPRI